MNIYENSITPTYLYIKQHSITGLKYFGKTISKNPVKYKGSGTYWKFHIKKHGKEFVETIWLSDPFVDKKILSEFAINFSKENNIVESNEWANLIPENGGDNNPRKCSDEHRANMSVARRARPPASLETRAKLSAAGMGKHRDKHTVETKSKMSIAATNRAPASAETRAKMTTAQQNRPPVTDEIKKILSEKAKSRVNTKCPYCGIECSGSNYTRWHGDNCKMSGAPINRPPVTEQMAEVLRIARQNKKPTTTETKQKLKMAASNRDKIECPHCNL
ncbi:MAG: NUMOD3 domain-containing DNA-binding protein, partial [Betaproteobacteria bacterium]